MPPSYPCPKCKASLPPAGDVTIEGAVLPVYQCDTCTKTVDFLGEPTEVALTFVPLPDGRLVDPADPDVDPSLN